MISGLYKKTALACLFLFLAVLPGMADENLINNGNFEIKTGNSLDYWGLTTWKNQEGAVIADRVKGGKAGAWAAVIRNNMPEDGKLVQSVPVKPNTTYRLSGWLKVEGQIEGALGANLSALEIMETSVDVKNEEEGWVFRELFGTTGPEQKNLTITLRLGGYGRLAQGRALFDDIRFEETIAVSSGERIVSFAPIDTAAQSQPAKPSSVPLLFFLSLIYLGILGLLFSKPVKKFFSGAGHSRWFIIILLLSGILVRFFIAANVTGHPTDLVCFKSWSTEAFQTGIPGFYMTETFKDYPPLYMYILYVIGAIKSLLGLSYESTGFLLLIKTPAILADGIIALLLLRMGKREWRPLLFAAFLFNPAIIINSAAYAQVDSVFTLLIALVLFCFMKKRFILSGALLGAALALKPQAFLFAPVGLFLIAAWLIKGVRLLRLPQGEERNTRKQEFLGEGKTSGLAVLAAAGTFLAVCLPFFLTQPGELIALYDLMFSSYPFASLNAFNLFSLFGLNWASASHTFLFLPVSAWNFIFMAGITIAAAFVYFKEKEHTRPFMTALLLAVLSFTLLARIHERYLFPAVFLAAAAFLITERKGFLYLFGALSVLSFFNQGIVLEAAMDNRFQIAANDWLLVAGSFFMCLAAAWCVMLCFGFNPFRGLKDRFSQKRPEAPVNLTDRNQPLKPSSTDLGVCIAFTVIFAILSFWNLGSLHTPTTFWQPENVGDAVTVELEGDQTVSQVGYYGGLGTGGYQLLVSNDGRDYRPAGTIVNTNPYAEFKWQVLPLQESVRFFRLAATQQGYALHELVLLDGRNVLPVRVESKSSSTASRGEPDALFDEQDTYPEQISYLNGMYFDEIYYARSSYQYLQGLPPAERTHPQLGKLIIASGIAVFGMTPFGWRFPGALIGVLMLPLLYLLARRLFTTTQAAVFTTILFAFDFMRFTQTRIATIDTFSVFFILLMYLFMAKFFTTPLERGGFRKLALPLLFSGIAFGLGAATKWTSLFAAPGLLALFIWKLISLVKDSRRHNMRPGMTFAAVAGWATLCFIVIPLVIYTLSFIPLQNVTGEGDLISLVHKEQVDMFRYHSELQATHPFSSSWWEWPLIVRPIWYYSGQPHLAPGLVANIVNMGTPVIWWLGILCIPAGVVLAIMKKSKGAAFVLIAFASQYLPWIISPRKLVFLYHFFAAVPFLLLALVWVIYALTSSHPLAAKRTRFIFTGAAVVLFILFYPVLSGALADKAYVESVLRWFPSWIFFN